MSCFEIIDPRFKALRPQELDGCNVFRIDPLDGSLAIVADDFSMPNGLAFSPDESVLYVADSGFLTDDKAPHHVRAFNVAGAKLTESRVFAEITPGIPDGLRVDVEGNVWISAADGVQCHTPDGELIGKIPRWSPISPLAVRATTGFSSPRPRASSQSS